MTTWTRRTSAMAAGALLAVSHAGAQAIAAASTASAAAAGELSGRGVLVELSKSLAWPLVVLVVLLWFRRPLADFLGAIGGRVGKFSVFNVEFELTAAKPSNTTPFLDDVRTVLNAAQISDSSRMLLEQAQSTEPADFSLIALGGGDKWLSSRLFIAAVMMERMRGVKVFVFVERAAGSECRFVAVADVRQLRWVLARRFPWLEAAFIAAQALQPEPPPITTAVNVMSNAGAMEPWMARQMVRDFIAALQRPPVPPAAAAPLPGEQDWVVLEHTQERARWITRSLLAELLPEQAFDAMAPALADSSRARRSRAVLRRPMPFVALVDEQQQFVRLVHRAAYLEEVAASLADEPE